MFALLKIGEAFMKDILSLIVLIFCQIFLFIYSKRKVLKEFFVGGWKSFE